MGAEDDWECERVPCAGIAVIGTVWRAARETVDRRATGITCGDHRNERQRSARNPSGRANRHV